MKRTGSILLSLALVIGAVAIGLPASALAENSAPEISLNAAVIEKNHTVWFGILNDTDVQWRVLSPSTDATLPVSKANEILLISNHVLAHPTYFKQDRSSSQWTGSDAQVWCAGLFNGWIEKEKGAISETTVKEENAGDPPHYYQGGRDNYLYGAASVDKERFFFLSVQEADIYFGKENDSDRIAAI